MIKLKLKVYKTVTTFLSQFFYESFFCERYQCQSKKEKEKKKQHNCERYKNLPVDKKETLVGYREN